MKLPKGGDGYMVTSMVSGLEMPQITIALLSSPFLFSS